MGEITNVTILWIRNDLRLRDNLALDYAISLGRPIVPVFILEEEVEAWQIGSASKWWLHYALRDFEDRLKEIGLSLHFSRGKSAELVLSDLVKKAKVGCVVWNRSYDQPSMERDRRVSNTMQALGVKVETFMGNVLFEPGSILNKTQKPFKVFTPFYNYVKDIPIKRSCLIKDKNIVGCNLQGCSKSIDFLNLLLGVNSSNDLGLIWDPSIRGGEKLLKKFVNEKIREYSVSRDFPGEEGTSRLSPYLHFGQISVRQVCDALLGLSPSIREPYYRQIIWREFAWMVLYFFPEMASHSYKKEFENFGWYKDDELLRCWKEGRTGYPIVDAGMRELEETGWMHNRVRMIVGSFLVKDLMIDWIEGARWFWEKLVDADLANNSFGWQWVAGSGLDATPFFRIFNPVLQSKKFDPDGVYIKRFVPELEKVPTKWIHAPWMARDLKIDYQQPVVSHSAARINTLRAYNRMKSSK